MSKQRRFSKAFRLEAIRQLESGQKNASDLARDLRAIGGHPLDFLCQAPVRIFSQLNGQEYNSMLYNRIDTVFLRIPVNVNTESGGT